MQKRTCENTGECVLLDMLLCSKFQFVKPLVSTLWSICQGQGLSEMLGAGTKKPILRMWRNAGRTQRKTRGTKNCTRRVGM